MKGYGVEKFSCIVSDNEPCYKLARAKICQKFNTLNIGCSAHSLNLVIQDIFSDPLYENMYSKLQDVISFFKKKLRAKTMLGRKQKEAKIRKSLTYPVPTRWLSIKESLDSLINLKRILTNFNDHEKLELVSIALKVKSKEIIDTIQSEIFWELCLKLNESISLPTMLIKKFEANNVNYQAYIMDLLHCMNNSKTTLE